MKNISLSDEEREKKQQYGCERYKKFSKDEKLKILEYRKKIMKYGKIKMLKK